MQSKEPKDGVIRSGAECIGSAAGSTVGALIGGVVAGPAGIVLGSISGTVVEKIMVTCGEEIEKRVLSKREAKKVGTAYLLAQEYIKEKLDQNQKLRDDNFFDAQADERSSAEEILEGTIFAAQREYEERKIVYLAKMYANILFCSDISRPMAGYLIKLAEQVTYRQIVILHAIGSSQMSAKPIQMKDAAYSPVEGINNVAIATEIFELYRMSLLSSKNVLFSPAGIVPSKLSVTGYGAHLFNLMELYKLESREKEDLVLLGEILAFMTGHTLVVED